MTTLDLDQLQEKVAEERVKLHYYTKAVEMLIKKYHISNYTDVLNMDLDSFGLDKEMFASICKGEMPTDDQILRADSEALDRFIQAALHIVGTILGVYDLQKLSAIDDDYSNFLLTERGDEMDVQKFAFSALSLCMERGPSHYALFTMFPVCKQQEMQQRQINTITELYAQVVQKYIIESDNH